MFSHLLQAVQANPKEQCVSKTPSHLNAVTYTHDSHSTVASRLDSIAVAAAICSRETCWMNLVPIVLKSRWGQVASTGFTKWTDSRRFGVGGVMCVGEIRKSWLQAFVKALCVGLQYFLFSFLIKYWVLIDLLHRNQKFSTREIDCPLSQLDSQL